MGRATAPWAGPIAGKDHSMENTVRHRIYLAGAMVFEAAPHDIYAEMKRLCEQAGLEGVAPLDGDIQLATLSKPDAARAIRCDNMRKIRECDGVVANITNFRGPNADDGTAWEMGYAEGLGKPVVPYSTSGHPIYADLVVATQGATLRPAGDGRLFAADGMAVEDFGLPANLMLAAADIPVQPSFAAALDVLVRLLGGKQPPPPLRGKIG
jgi:nucleoside 2-deoxyribosyltransferase